MKVVVVGGVAGGASAAARLRRLDEQAEIIMLEQGEYISYANCGLPYYISGEIEEKADLLLHTPESFRERTNVDVRTRHRALSINRVEKTVEIENLTDGTIYEESYDKVILSPGAKPAVPPIPGLDLPAVFTLRNIPDTDRIKKYVEEHKPKHAVVMGGGYIGIELAEALMNCGLSVSLIEAAEHVIASIDYDMAAMVHNYMRHKGIDLHLNEMVQEVVETDGQLTVTTAEGAITTDMLLVSTGVTPDSKLAQDCGISTDKDGAINTNEYMQTNDPDIYAIGDAISIKHHVTQTSACIPLAGPANKQGRVVADHISGLDSSYHGTQGSAILRFFDLTIASTGICESLAQSADIEYDRIYLHPADHATYYPGTTYMSIKVLFNKENGTLLGAQIIGQEGVDKRCDVLATAIRSNMSCRDLIKLELCYAPPYSSAKDPVNMVGFMMENVRSGRLKQFHWEDVPSLIGREDITLLDVRSLELFNESHLRGSIHIPLGQLRAQMDTLDKSKPVYVYCTTGLNSYNACRVLSQNGFDCYNLAGGCDLYLEIVADKKATEK